MSADVDVNSINAMGKTAYHFTEGTDHIETRHLLRKSGANYYSPPIFPKLTGPYIGQELAGGDAVMVAPGIISLENMESSPPAFSKDGSEVYWATKTIMHMKIVDGQWTAPAPASFVTEYGENGPVFSVDGSKLFFRSRRPIEGTTESKRQNIWYVERVGDGWSEAKVISEAVNKYKPYWSFNLDEDDTIYFASSHFSSHGMQDIYKSEYKNGEYQEPINMGSLINSDKRETTPYMAPDKSYLIFSVKDREPELGTGDDLYITFSQSDGGWTEPKI